MKVIIILLVIYIIAFKLESVYFQDRTKQLHNITGIKRKQRNVNYTGLCELLMHSFTFIYLVVSLYKTILILKKVTITDIQGTQINCFVFFDIAFTRNMINASQLSKSIEPYKQFYLQQTP